ncbi:signal peptide peptidase SppA [soil metagenome]
MDAIERDFYEERRRRWRRSAFWRGFVVAALIAIVISAFSIRDAIRAGSAHVARVEISGIITEDVEKETLLRSLAERSSVRAVILRINSPGGTTTGSEALYNAVRQIAAEKPVVAVLGEIAASGGYIAALSADHIVAHGNTLTGSIGVIMEYPDLTDVLDRFGIGVETMRSSELKGEPSPWRPSTAEGRAMQAALVEESYAWFRDLVGARRGLAGEALGAVANGGVFTGRLALENGLVDAIGGEGAAMAWLESREAGLGALPVRGWEIERDEPLLGRLIGASLPAGGFIGELSRLTVPKLYSLAR